MKKGFNLLKPQAEPPSVWTKVYDWVVGSARLIIIAVEMLVLVAFGTRVIIDFQSKELDKEIEDAETILSILKEGELKFRNIQQRTNAYKQIWNNTTDYLPMIENINKYLPVNSDIKDLSISIEGEYITITGTSSKSQEDLIKQLENNLKSQSDFLEGTTLESLEDSTDQLKFIFKAKLININKKVLYGNSGS